MHFLFLILQAKPMCVCVIVTFTGFGLIFLNFLQVHGMLVANSVHFSTLNKVISADGCHTTAPCGLRGCKNRPAPFPRRMS